jgi:branched-chain amino acid transport system ATP-binding protein
MTTMLDLRNVSASYGPVDVLHGVSLAADQGQIVTLIGANGAGKTTLLMTLCGEPRAKSGSLVFEGRNITNLATDEIMRLGIAHVPEGRRIFPRMSVLENLQMGAYTQPAKNFASDLEKAYALFPRLKERHNQMAGTLSGGEQQMLALGRALMSRPKLLLLDEPSLGLAPLVVKQIFAALATLNREGLTLFLVEQNARAALKLAHYGYVMVNGRITLEGTGAELLGNASVRSAYLDGETGLNKGVS